MIDSPFRFTVVSNSSPLWQFSTKFCAAFIEQTTMRYGNRHERIVVLVNQSFEIDGVTKYRNVFAGLYIPFNNPRPIWFDSSTVLVINHLSGRFNSILSVANLAYLLQFHTCNPQSQDRYSMCAFLTFSFATSIDYVQ